MAITRMIKAIVKRKTAPAKTGASIKGSGGCPVLDYPQKGEVITSPYYTFRAGASGDIEKMEISINQGSWQPCRYSAGHWWYDWAGYTDGRYEAAVRARTKDGQVFTSDSSKFLVVLGAGGKRPK